MRVLEIPIASSEPYFSQENEVFGETFFLEFEWIERGEFWAFHILDTNEKPLALGIKLKPNWPLFRYHKNPNPIGFTLLPLSSNQTLKRHNLCEHFILVAYAAV